MCGASSVVFILTSIFRILDEDVARENFLRQKSAEIKSIFMSSAEDGVKMERSDIMATKFKEDFCAICVSLESMPRGGFFSFF